MKFECIAVCLFGLEATVKFELKNLGIKLTDTTDGRVGFLADEYEIAKANIGLRCAERVLVKIGSFKASTFEELYQGMFKLPLENYIGIEDKFPITKAKSINSKLFSIPDIQAVSKKGAVERLKMKHRTNELKEIGKLNNINIFINKDTAEVTIDTSGAALHKRGYREFSGGAPIRETLAAYMVMLTPWHEKRLLIDPMCGSGTIAIEAAMIGKHIMPGINRNFAGEEVSFISKAAWTKARKEAIEEENDCDFKIYAYDKDPKVIEIAKENAEVAGVERYIEFKVQDFADLKFDTEYGFLITNPPYGERMGEEDIEGLYRLIGSKYKVAKNWSFYIITSNEELETFMRVKYDKKKKLYNGSLTTYYYMFPGSKPPKQ
ncbi:MAG: THUMP domain-containing class I SAM-dependent RNA methyltransferase [Filifactoraceae bacterium]